MEPIRLPADYYLPYDEEKTYFFYEWMRRHTPRDHYRAWRDTFAMYPQALPHEYEIRQRYETQYPPSSESLATTWR